MRTKKVSILTVVVGFAALGCTTSSPSADVPAAIPPASTPPLAARPTAVTPSTPTARSTEPVLVTAPAKPVAPIRATPSPAAYPPDDLPRRTGQGSWPFVSSFGQLVDAADLFVVGEVIKVAPAPDRGGTLPYTNSTIHVTDVVKGRSESGDTVTVFQTGGVYSPTHAIEDQQKSPGPLPSEAPDGVKPRPPASVAPLVLLEFEDNPLFRVGNRVALALTWNPELPAYLLATGPQARFEVDDRGKVHPMAQDDPAVEPLDGISLEEFIARVRAAAE